MMDTTPQVRHVYLHHHLDSARWEQFTPRADDIIISTSYKSGTTWMQNIIQHLIFQDLQSRPIWDFSPWLDMRLNSLDEVLGQLAAQEHRRCIKSHLPLDGLVYFAQPKYIIVARDARDVFMSLWNHYSNYTPEMYERLNDPSSRVGDLFPTCPQDIRELWRWWMGRGWFEWESEGYPYWSNLHHTQTWWDYRHLPNILLVHYNDLSQNLEGEIRRVAEFLNVQLPAELLPPIAHAVSFSSMKQNAERLVPGSEETFKGGPQTFINKGTNGRWREILNDDDLELYTAAVARELTPDCARWLENGRLASA
jgi:aryl sulfotransferase